jgi:TonB family protein
MTRKNMRTVLKIWLDRDGRPQRNQVQTGSGSTELDEIGQDYVMGMRFSPCVRGGVAVAAEITYDINWQRP